MPRLQNDVCNQASGYSSDASVTSGTGADSPDGCATAATAAAYRPYAGTTANSSDASTAANRSDAGTTANRSDARAVANGHA